jgi:hypothetical protein
MIIFDKKEAIQLLTNIINNCINIKKDDYGYFFYNGVNFDNIEHKQNRKLINDNMEQFKKIFKKHTNWNNMFNSQKLVCNLIKWSFCKIENIKPYPSITTKIPKVNNYIRKYYIPKYIKIDEKSINKLILTFN